MFNGFKRPARQSRSLFPSDYGDEAEGETTAAPGIRRFLTPRTLISTVVVCVMLAVLVVLSRGQDHTGASAPQFDRAVLSSTYEQPTGLPVESPTPVPPDEQTLPVMGNSGQLVAATQVTSLGSPTLTMQPATP